MIHIAFTIGHTGSYTKALTQPPVTKIGRTEDYPGGAAFRTVEEAKAFLHSETWDTIDWGDGKPRDAKNFSVYSLTLPGSWEESTYQLPGEEFHCLSCDAIIEGLASECGGEK